ncbi:MAG: hypothetical protein ABIB47_06145 [Candidatus Woesearchaeota archaeon]
MKRKERKFWPGLFKNIFITAILIILLFIVFIVVTTFTSLFG